MTKFREFLTSSGKIVLVGKNAENNEELIKQVKKDEYVLHTEKPGSPFVNIKENFKKVSRKDLKEAAIFCASYSKDWKKNKGNVIVHYFLGEDIYKTNEMKTGTFGVKKFKEITIKREEILNFIEKLEKNG